jgi:hypothetical protein
MDYEKLYYFPTNYYKFYIHRCFKTLYFTGVVVKLGDFKYPCSFKGRYPGVFILVILQLLMGTIHAVIGFFLIFVMSGVLIYSVYTVLFGLFTIVFAYGLWVNIKSGWLGTIFLSLFVIIVDISTVLDLPLIAGVPRSAAFGEIVYSLIILLYLFQPKIIQLFKKINSFH